MDFSVQFGAVEQASNALRQIGQQLLSISETLEQRVLAGTAELEGSTQIAFQQAHQNYQQIHQQLQMQVQAGSPALNRINESYMTNEQRGAALWA
jgi:uncharacterized protein YukE